MKWGDLFDLDHKRDRIEELERTMEDPGFWNDADKSAEIVRECKNLKTTVEEYEKLCAERQDMLDTIELYDMDNDASGLDELNSQFREFEEKYETLRISNLLTGEYDNNNAILTLHAGAGGTESTDWVGMLCRMYQRWAASKGFKVEMIDFLEGDEAGFKSVTLQIDGENAYGLLKSEHGVHRLVRISPFNAAGKRETSFASCDVMPDIEKDLDVEIKDEDIRIDTYRSSGAGGQHINKTSSAIRITHFPTGIVVTCQNERSQLQNKNKAMQILKSKLYLKKVEEEEAKANGIRGEEKDNGWGSQIRSYVLQPYTMVKDHRTNKEIGNAQSVLDGNIDPFIEAYLSWLAAGRHKDKGV